MPITSQLVKDFYAEALKKFGGQVKGKADSDFMVLVGKFLDGIGVMNKEEFMKEFTTTIGTVIYAPFEVGVDGGAEGYDLWQQISVLVHELTHVQQYNASPAEFMVKYLASRSDRASYEAEAYGSDLEMCWWKYGHGYNIPERVKALAGYALKQEHIDYAAEFLATYNDVFAQGGSISAVAKWAKEWLDAHSAK